MPSIEQQLEEKVDALGLAFQEFKKENDQRLTELKKKGSVDPILEEKVKKANEDVGRLDEEIKSLRTALNRAPTQTEIVDKKDLEKHAEYKGRMPFLFTEKGFNTDADGEYKAAMVEFMRRGVEGKALSVGSDPDGGYLVRPEVGAMVQTKIFETSPFRQYMGQQAINSDALEFPTDGDEAAAEWVSEQGSRSSTGTPQIGLKRIETFELHAQPKATQRILDDASINAESWIAMKAADKFMRTENNAFASGTGAGQPRGFLTYAAGTSAGQIEQVNSGSSSALTADGVISLQAALKTAYRAGAVWFMTRTTLSVVRQLKDSYGQYLWQPGLQAGIPSQLLGNPVAEAADMPEVASNALAVAYGNFKVGYMIVDRIGLRILRDPYTAKPFVLFDYTKRVGGDVVVNEAIKIQKVHS